MKKPLQGFTQRYLKSLATVLAGATVTCAFLIACFVIAKQQVVNMGEDVIELAAASQERSRQRMAEAQASSKRPLRPGV